MINTITYILTFFAYSVLTVIFLPTPVEVGLFNPYIHPLILVSVLAVGKGIGAFIIFYIGAKIRKAVIKRPYRWLDPFERFIKRFGNLGLFIIMSIPLMLDSVTLYLFSLLNPEGGIKRKNFVIINTVAGFVRGSIVVAFIIWFEIKLF